MDKCSILEKISEYLTSLRYALKYPILSVKSLIDFFSQANGCEDVPECHEVKSCDTSVSVICNLVILANSSPFRPDGILSVGLTFKGGISPYEVLWGYNGEDLTLISGQGTSNIVLKGDLETLFDSQTIDVSVKDARECISELSFPVSTPHATVNCSSFTLTGGSLYKGTPFSGSFTILYSGGNGISYAAYEVESVGVPGLKATLAAGTLSAVSGNHELTFIVEGTPTEVGAASFPLELFGVSCSPTISVNDTFCPQVVLSQEAFDYSPTLAAWPVKLSWSTIPGISTYKLSVSINGGVATEVTPTTNSYYIYVPGGGSFTAQLTTVCSETNESIPASVSRTLPEAPMPPGCTPVDSVLVSIGDYDLLQSKWEIIVDFGAVADAVTYTILLNGTPVTTTENTSVTVYGDSDDSVVVSVITNCADNNSEPIEAESITLPPAPFPPAIDAPVFNILDNVIATPSHVEIWATLYPTSTWIEFLQGPAFGNYISDSGQILKGNVMKPISVPTPPGFGSDDVYFNVDTVPESYPIVGNTITKLRSKVRVSGGFIYYYDHIMNIPSSLGLRQDTIDYIPMYNDGVIRPSISASAIGTGTVKITFNPSTLNYDSCSVYNMFLVGSTGTIIPATPATYSSLSYTFTGVPAGTYLVYFEMTHDKCTTTPAPYVTAQPIFVTIP